MLGEGIEDIHMLIFRILTDQFPQTYYFEAFIGKWLVHIFWHRSDPDFIHVNTARFCLISRYPYCTDFIGNHSYQHGLFTNGWKTRSLDVWKPVRNRT